MLIPSVLAGGRRGRWRLGDHLRVVAIFTVRTLNLGAAQPEAPELVVTVVTAFGGASIIEFSDGPVPPAWCRDLLIERED